MLAVHEKHDDIRHVYGHIYLLFHLGVQSILTRRVDAAGIDEGKGMSAPFHIGIDAVAGHAGGILHDGDPAAHHTVEKGGFPYIWAAHNGHQRFVFHRYSFP